MRLVTDPHVRLVMRAIERSITSKARDRSLVSGTVNVIVLETAADDRQRFEAWPDDAVRAVALAFVLNCPEAELDRMAKEARAEIRAIGQMEREFAAEDANAGPLAGAA